MLKIDSPLSDDVEQLMHDTIGCCITVHRELGPGLFERVYSRAVCLELTAAGISFEREKRYQVRYRGEVLCEQCLDFVVGNQIVLEIKSIESVRAYTSQADPQLYAYRESAGWLVDELQCCRSARRHEP
jgi:GxxExxY protein